MIRALFGFVVTVALISAAALWALGSFDRVERLRAPPPVSRTVELIATEISKQIGPEVSAIFAAEEADAPTTPEPARFATLVDRDEIVEDEAEPFDAAPHEVGGAAPGEGALIASGAAGEAPSAPDAVRSAARPSGAAAAPDRHEQLADSALLVRRMLGLYQQSLEQR